MTQQEVDQSRFAGRQNVGGCGELSSQADALTAILEQRVRTGRGLDEPHGGQPAGPPARISPSLRGK